MAISQQVQEGVKTSVVGLTGTGASIGLQNFSLVFSIVVAGLTSVYISIKIYKELRKG
jgi:hypothetical protein|tara:strand:- start:122 stop:295 length:174 start_codon:yes stop_codon:yes gene_type:complete